MSTLVPTPSLFEMWEYIQAKETLDAERRTVTVIDAQSLGGLVCIWYVVSDLHRLAVIDLGVKIKAGSAKERAIKQQIAQSLQIMHEMWSKYAS